MTLYDTVKVFDLAKAPDELREADDFAVLKTGFGEEGCAILFLKVGEYESRKAGPINDVLTREVTFAEYQLHRWLAEHGAADGEGVFLQWKPAVAG